MSTTFQTYRVGLDPEGEDRFIPFDPESYGAPITETTIDGDFDFPIDFEYVGQGTFVTYDYIPDYMRVKSSGRVQYYFLTPISVADPKYVNDVLKVHPIKFAAHKDVCATFHTEYLKYQTGSRIYQGHYLGAQGTGENSPAYAPDWSQTPRYMPYHFSEIQQVHPLFRTQAYGVIIYITQKTSGIKSCLVTSFPLYQLWGGNTESVGDLIYGIKDISSLGSDPALNIESVDDIKVVPWQVISSSEAISNPKHSYQFHTGPDRVYELVLINDVLYGVTTYFESPDDITIPPYANIPFEIGAGNSWIKVAPSVQSRVANALKRPGVGFNLFFGAGGTFQLIMEVLQRYSCQSIDLSDYCTVPYYWLNTGDKAQQTTAAALQTVSAVLGTTASIALAVPTGGVSLIGAASGAVGTAGGVAGLVDAIQKAPPTTSGAGSFPGAFVDRSPDTPTAVTGFPFVREYTVSYSDTVGQAMRGAYAENTDGEPFYLSIYEQWKQLHGTESWNDPRYIYICADAVPLRTPVESETPNNNTAMMAQDDMDEFRRLLRRGLRLWFQYSTYVPGNFVAFRRFISG